MNNRVYKQLFFNFGENKKYHPQNGSFGLPWWLRRLPTMGETRVQSLSREDFLEKEMATHSSILA